MPIEKIAEIVIKNGLWTSRGKTPKVSVASRIYVDMKRRGIRSRFVKTHAGTIDIRNAESLFGEGGIAGEGLTYGERTAAKRFIASAKALDGKDFEALVRKLMESSGISEIEAVRRTKSKRDEVNLAGYITLLGALSIRIRVLATRWKSGQVSSATIDSVRRDLAPGDRGVVISLDGFSGEAAKAAESDGEPPIMLLTGEDFFKLVE